MGSLAEARGQFAAALAYYARTLRLWETSLEPGHPNIGMVLNNMGSAYLAAGDVPQAVAHLQRGLANWEAKYGAGHPDVAMALSNLGRAHLQGKDEDSAVVVLERAIAICAAQTCEEDVQAEAPFALAKALWPKGDRARARELAGKARAVYAKKPHHAKTLAEVDAWLAAH
jgi:tetratricopeptide (TPR) repeat protein